MYYVIIEEAGGSLKDFTLCMIMGEGEGAWPFADISK